MNNILKLPFYVKFAFLGISAFAFFLTLYIGQQIILPLIYATIFAILLNPVVNFLIRHKIRKFIAISLVVLSTIIITISLFYVISAQLSLVSEAYPKLKEKYNVISAQTIIWTSEHFNIKAYKIKAWINETQINAINNMSGAIGQTISIVNSILIIMVLLPVYLFMILYYKDLFLEFIRKIFKTSDHEAVFEILMRSKLVIQSYLFGLLIEMVIIASLNSIGLLMIGLDYAIILGITGALLNIIPYIGGVVAIILPMIIALVTKDSSSYVFLVFGIYLIIQFIDNHFIIPLIVASKVKINALISIVVVLTGGALWGIPGMFLSIPLTAILKVIFDHIEQFKPWGFLLGNMVSTSKLSLNFLKGRKKKAEIIFKRH